MAEELRIAQSQVKLLDPEYTTDLPDLQFLLALIYEPILRWENGRLQQGLVTSWQLSKDGRSLLLTLRPDASFHDGSPCTVEHVIQALERLQTAEGAFGMGGVYTPYLEELEVTPLKNSQLLVTGPGPVGDLVDILMAVYVGKPSGSKLPPLGTGPYRLDDHREGEFIRLTAADESMPGAQYAKLNVVEIREAEARYDSLKSGQADLASGFESLADIPVEDKLSWRRSVNTLSVTCFLNGFEEPFSQPEARLAVNLAVDVDTIIHTVWRGLAESATTVVSQYHFGYPGQLRPHAYDPMRAKELFERCSMPDELILRTPLVIPDRAPLVAHLIREQLDRIGIRVRIEEEEDRPKYARDVSKKHIGHMALFDSSPLSTYRVLQEKISSKMQGLWWQGVQDDTADQLILAAHKLSSTCERAMAYSRGLSWLHDHPHWLYLYQPAKLYAHRPEVLGVGMNHAGLLTLPMKSPGE